VLAERLPIETAAKFVAKPFMENKIYIRCCEPCVSRLHLSCLKMSDTEYTFYMAEGESTFKCAECVKVLRSSRDENTPIRSMRSASTSELHKKLLSPGREVLLPNLKDSDSLSVQIKTVRLNGVNTTNLVENLVEMVLKLSEEVQNFVKKTKFLSLPYPRLLYLYLSRLYKQ
jgi:hypothetical protein